MQERVGSMEIDLAILYAQEPNRIIDPENCNYATAIINGLILDREEAEYELRLAVDKEHDRLFTEHKVNAIADRKIKLTEVYQKWERSKIELKRLGRLRATLRDRFAVLTMTRRY